MKSLCTVWNGDFNVILLLPRKVVIVKSLGEPCVYLLNARLLKLLCGIELGEISLCIRDLSILKVPYGSFQVMSLTVKGYDGHLHHLAHLSERFGQLAHRSAVGISCLGIEDKHVTVIKHSLYMTDKHKVGCELTLTDTANVSKKPLFQGKAEKSVDSNNVICSVGEYSTCYSHKIIEGVVITDQKIGGLKSLASVLYDPRLLRQGKREGYSPGYRS